MDKLEFYKKMQAAKKKKAQEAKDKKLKEDFSLEPPPIPLDSRIEEHLVLPTSPVEPVEARTVVVKSQTPLERTIQTLREKAQGL